jgi:hypothetical protein
MVESMSEAESMDEQTVESTVAPSSEPVLKKGKRPLSPHLQIYKPQITSVLSIIHRFTGLISVVAITCIVVWLFLVSVGGHVISQSEKRVKHIFLVYNAHPSCKIKNLDKIQRIMHKELRYIENKIPHLHVIVTLVPNTLSSIC